jgi:hypothetical protein
MMLSWSHVWRNWAKGNRGGETGRAGRPVGFARPGRVLFRNTRAGMKGFPKRTARLARLGVRPEAEHWLDRVSTEFAEDAGDTRLQAR